MIWSSMAGAGCSPGLPLLRLGAATRGAPARGMGGSRLDVFILGRRKHVQRRGVGVDIVPMKSVGCTVVRRRLQV
jgi:hypothetical protein